MERIMSSAARSLPTAVSVRRVAARNRAEAMLLCPRVHEPPSGEPCRVSRWACSVLFHSLVAETVWLCGASLALECPFAEGLSLQKGRRKKCGEM